MFGEKLVYDMTAIFKIYPEAEMTRDPAHIQSKYCEKYEKI